MLTVDGFQFERAVVSSLICIINYGFLNINLKANKICKISDEITM